MAEVYCLTFPNGKKYIGMTEVGHSVRWRDHRYHANMGSQLPVHRAIRKYGAENVVVEVIGLAEDRAELCALERSAIIEHGSRSPRGYNATDGGDGASVGNSHHLGHQHSSETKTRMSESRKGRSLSLSDAERERRRSLVADYKFALGRVESESEQRQRARGIALSDKSPRATSGHRGVGWCKQTSKWRAHIGVRGKFKDLGRYDRLEDAVAARRMAEEAIYA